MDLALPQITNDLVCPLRQKPQGARVGHFEIGPLHSVLQKRGRVNLVRPDTFYKSVNLDLQNVKKIFWDASVRIGTIFMKSLLAISSGSQWVPYRSCKSVPVFPNIDLRSNRSSNQVNKGE